MMRIFLTVSTFFVFSECCIKTVSPDDMIPPGSCLLDCTLPYSCAGITAPGGICEPLSAIGNPKVTTTDHVTCDFTFTCPMLNYGSEGYQTWYQDLAGVWSDIFGTNGDTIVLTCTSATANEWSMSGLSAVKFACAY